MNISVCVFDIADTAQGQFSADRGHSLLISDIAAEHCDWTLKLPLCPAVNDS